ncbi:hypothetical protein HPB51_011665 [Rhipicephalus microplus]|uniref:Uncharacterized protein n=1 Tax=Rhipicephalus microplus TaxID=6941 RepID=A0A9J6ETI5_RHIMP|nr:hypothetical protein HPB51_011665 [Rhipicephalus microplus]
MVSQVNEHNTPSPKGSWNTISANRKRASTVRPCSELITVRIQLPPGTLMPKLPLYDLLSSFIAAANLSPKISAEVTLQAEPAQSLVFLKTHSPLTAHLQPSLTSLELNGKPITIKPCAPSPPISCLGIIHTVGGHFTSSQLVHDLESFSSDILADAPRVVRVEKRRAESTTMMLPSSSLPKTIEGKVDVATTFGAPVAASMPTFEDVFAAAKSTLAAIDPQGADKKERSICDGVFYTYCSRAPPQFLYDALSRTCIEPGLDEVQLCNHSPNRFASKVECARSCVHGFAQADKCFDTPVFAKCGRCADCL